jgi:hypothetical protein
LAERTEKAFFNRGSIDSSDNPRRRDGADEITPDRRTTGTTDFFLRQKNNRDRRKDRIFMVCDLLEGGLREGKLAREVFSSAPPVGGQDG